MSVDRLIGYAAVLLVAAILLFALFDRANGTYAQRVGTVASRWVGGALQSPITLVRGSGGAAAFPDRTARSLTGSCRAGCHANDRGRRRGRNRHADRDAGSNRNVYADGRADGGGHGHAGANDYGNDRGRWAGTGDGDAVSQCPARPANFQLVTRFDENAILSVLQGPVQANNYQWWEVRNDQGQGWCADEWLQAVP
ncbi:MAG: hypothetical protein HZY76_05670 [Anaerolineae bacterium]|nr:MAG: hypothetical protein HZY76_05670 [Anaerolineae bacterium]